MFFYEPTEIHTKFMFFCSRDCIAAKVHFRQRKFHFFRMLSQIQAAGKGDLGISHGGIDHIFLGHEPDA